jgi:hypothetical protein
MFAKRKEKNKKENTESAEKIIRVLKINKKRFVVGLQWQTIKFQANIMKEVKAIGRAKNLDVVAIRKSDAYQAGFAPKTKQPLRGAYSLIVALASLMEGCCIAVVDVGTDENGETEYTLSGRNMKGGIHPMSDEVIPEKELYQAVIDMKGQLRGNDESMDVPVYGSPLVMERFEWIEDVIEIEKLLSPENLVKEFKLKPLTWGMTDRHIIALGAFLLIAGLAIVFISHYLNAQREAEQERKAKLIQQQNELNRKLRYKAALEAMQHPWIKQPSVANFIKGCRNALRLLHPSEVGWVPVQVICFPDSVTVDYLRPQGSVATTADFIKSVKEHFKVDVSFNYNKTSQTEFSFKIESPPEGDDPMSDIGDQLVKMISLFQSVNISASFNPVPIKDIKKNKYGEDMPKQDWQEYRFSVQSDVNPQLIFKNNSFNGVRINKIIYRIDQSGGIQYQTEGSVYGKR